MKHYDNIERFVKSYTLDITLQHNRNKYMHIIKYNYYFKGPFLNQLYYDDYIFSVVYSLCTSGESALDSMDIVKFANNAPLFRVQMLSLFLIMGFKQSFMNCHAHSDVAHSFYISYHQKLLSDLHKNIITLPKITNQSFDSYCLSNATIKAKYLASKNKF